MRRHIVIPSGETEIAADLHLPDAFDATGLYPVIVISTPGSSVKEQIAANYAVRLAGKGFVAVAFDPTYQGQSTGEPRDLEDPYRRGEDISSVIDGISNVPGIDAHRVGVLGICAGGGYAVHTARTDHRIKAIGTVVPVNVGISWRGAGLAPDGPAAALDNLAESRIQEVASGEPVRVNWLPDTLEDAATLGVTDIDSTQAVTYYRTPRGSNERSTNRRLLRSDSLLTGYDAFHLADQLLTQPLQVIIAGRKGITGQYEMGTALHEMAPNPADLLVIEGAGHYEMYDDPRYVDQAVERLSRFYSEHL